MLCFRFIQKSDVSETCAVITTVFYIFLKFKSKCNICRDNTHHGKYDYD